jgi:hypothetical protein
MFVTSTYVMFLAPDSDDLSYHLQRVFTRPPCRVLRVTKLLCLTQVAFFSPRAYHPSFEDATVDVADVIPTS